MKVSEAALLHAILGITFRGAAGRQFMQWNGTQSSAKPESCFEALEEAQRRNNINTRTCNQAEANAVLYA